MDLVEAAAYVLGGGAVSELVRRSTNALRKQKESDTAAGRNLREEVRSDLDVARARVTELEAELEEAKGARDAAETRAAVRTVECEACGARVRILEAELEEERARVVRLETVIDEWHRAAQRGFERYMAEGGPPPSAGFGQRREPTGRHEAPAHEED